MIRKLFAPLLLALAICAGPSSSRVLAADAVLMPGGSGDTAVFASAGGEFLVFKLPRGWDLLARRSEADMEQLQWLPNGQESALWTDVISVQSFAPMGAMTPSNFLTQVPTRFMARCEGTVTSEPQASRINGFPAATTLIGCPRRLSTDLGEVAFYIAIAGDRRFYVLQRAWRVAPFDKGSFPVTAADLADAQSDLGRAIPCVRGDNRRGCPANALDAIRRAGF